MLVQHQRQAPTGTVAPMWCWPHQLTRS